VSANEPRNSSIRLSLTGSRASTTATTPKPYIGHSGPLRKPLFTNLPVLRAANITSEIQPIIAYAAKNSSTSSILKTILISLLSFMDIYYHRYSPFCNKHKQTYV